MMIKLSCFLISFTALSFSMFGCSKKETPEEIVKQAFKEAVKELEEEAADSSERQLQIKAATNFLNKVKKINEPIQKREIKLSQIMFNEANEAEVSQLQKEIVLLSKNAIDRLKRIETSNLKGSDEYITSMIAILEVNTKVAEPDATMLKLEEAVERNDEELAQKLLLQLQKEAQVAQNDMLEKRMRFKKAQYDFGDANYIKIYRDKESEEYFKQLDKIDNVIEESNNELTEATLSESEFQKAINSVVARGEAANAIEYSNALSGIAESYMIKMVIFIQNPESDNRDKYLEDCNAAVDEAIRKLNSIKPYKNGEELLEVLKKRAEFHRGVFKNDFAEINKITSKEKMSLADVEKLESLIKDVGVKEKLFDAEALQAQKDFMVSHNINLKEVRGSKLKEKFEKETPQVLDTLERDLEILKKNLKNE